MAKSTVMDAPLSERARVREPREKEDRSPEFVVWARSSPQDRNWCRIGAAWKRERGEGFSVKLGALPLGNWNGVMKLVPPFVQEEDVRDVRDDPI
jgi:hypothetical protein